MASTSSIRETSSEHTGDLATLICKGDEVSEEVLKLFAEKGQIDVPDKDGRTTLMLACLEGLKDTVSFLLTSGANPNSKCSKDGNTPMHYACTVDYDLDKILSGRYYSTSDWITLKLPIVKLLLSHGALAVQDNLDGWSPPCVASLYMLTDVVDLFLSIDGIPLEVKIKVAEILGVSQAIWDEHYSFEKAFHSFSRAISYQQDAIDAGLPKAHPEISELAMCFSKISLKECCTQEEIKSVKESRVALKAHAFLVGERLFPLTLKRSKLYPAFRKFGKGLMYEDKMFEEGFQVLSCCLGLECQGDLKLGSVAVRLKHPLFPHMFRDKVSSQNLQCTLDLLRAYESILDHAPIDSLSDNVGSLMEGFGDILFEEAFFSSNIEIFKSTVQVIEKLMRIIQGRIQKENPEKYLQMPSVTFGIMDLLYEKYCFDEMYTLIHPRSLLRVKFVTLKLLSTDVSYKGRSGDNVLHLIAHCATVSEDYDTASDLVDLARAFVRHGCPIDMTNNYVQTARSILEHYNPSYQDYDPTLLMLVSPPTTALCLQELAIRAVLQHRISYKDKLPPIICKMMETEIQESELKEANEGSWSSSDWETGSEVSERESRELDSEELDSEDE